MNRKIFFAEIRPSLFKGKLTQQQVNGFNVLLDHAKQQHTNIEYLAYILATTYHETGFTMRPIKERGGAKYFRKRYDIHGTNPKLARRLGNTSPGDGVKYCGKGYVQITGKGNYAKAGGKLGIDLVNHPDLAMVPKHAVRILFQGMMDGWFTGKKLSSYMDGIDGTDAEDRQQYKLSRWLINGKDKRDEIAGHAIKFEHALRSAASTSEIPTPESHTTDEAVPLPEDDTITHTPATDGFVAVLVKIVEAILRMLKK